MFPCEHCEVVFKEKSSLLRHISHKPICKKYYGEEKFNDLKRKANLASKRKWKHEHSDQEKEKYRKQKEIKSSKEYEAFEELFLAAYSKAKKNLWNKLYDDAFDNIFDDAEEQALDDTLHLDSFDFQHLFNKNVGFHYDEDGDAAYEKDCDIYEEIERAIEDTHERKVEEKLQELSQEWIRKRQLNITSNCLGKCRRKVFAKHFNDFKEGHFNGIQDMAMDDAFLLLLSKGDIEMESLDKLDKVERCLEQNFQSTFKDGLKRFEKTDFFDKIVNLIYEVIYEENEKLNKTE